jgi:hypothetical protein
MNFRSLRKIEKPEALPNSAPQTKRFASKKEQL